MMRSLYSGVSGLKTHQTKMDVIGNNIANVNTTSYKTMSINFSDLMYQTTQAATGPNPNTGTAGMNPKQIGLGVQSAAITTKITEQGATQTTGNPFDLKIAGDEFFVVSNGSNTFFTRDGSFYVDADGNLAMSSTGYKVMGWQTEETADGTLKIKKDTVTPLVVMSEGNKTYSAAYTEAAVAAGIVDWNDKDQLAASGKIMNLQFYDNLGFSYTAKLSLHNGVKAEGKDSSYTFYTQVEDILDSTGKSILTDKSKIKYGSDAEVDLYGEEYGVQGLTVGKQNITLADGTTTTMAYVNYTDTATGTTSSVILYPADANVPGATQLFNAGGVPQDETLFKAIYGTSIKMSDVKASTIDPKTGTMKVTKKMVEGGVTLSYSGYDGSLQNPKTTVLDLSGLGDAFTSIEVDFTKTLVSDNKGKSTVAMDRGNLAKGKRGRELGSLQGVSIQTDGMIYASYSNGQQKLLGQIAVAQFANASGLQKEGDNLYSQTNNSGEFNGIGVDISANGHKMTTGTLEMSNVDLSSEFTDMITTQRGYQANSRIITVSDTLLEELVNLKR